MTAQRREEAKEVASQAGNPGTSPHEHNGVQTQPQHHSISVAPKLRKVTPPPLQCPWAPLQGAQL